MADETRVMKVDEIPIILYIIFLLEIFSIELSTFFIFLEFNDIILDNFLSISFSEVAFGNFLETFFKPILKSTRSDVLHNIQTNVSI